MRENSESKTEKEASWVVESWWRSSERLENCPLAAVSTEFVSASCRWVLSERVRIWA